MAAATLACALPGRTTVSGGACHRTSFPDFTTVLRSMGARITTRAQSTEGVSP
jgi:3-phosphoshikimate 1-carboxyvinyltransferase